MDFIYLALGVVLFLSLVGLARGCAALGRRRS